MVFCNNCFHLGFFNSVVPKLSKYFVRWLHNFPEQGIQIATLGKLPVLLDMFIRKAGAKHQSWVCRLVFPTPAKLLRVSCNSDRPRQHNLGLWTLVSPDTSIMQSLLHEPPWGSPGDHDGQVSVPADFSTSESDTLSTLTSLLLMIQNKEAEWEASWPWKGSYELGLNTSKLSREWWEEHSLACWTVEVTWPQDLKPGFHLLNWVYKWSRLSGFSCVTCLDISGHCGAKTFSNVEQI